MNEVLPFSLAQQPQLDRWLNFDPEGYLSLRIGKVELGQGIRTALAIICADELKLSIGQVHVEPVDTNVSPDEMLTAGSMSIETSGAAVRQVSAEAKWFLLNLAAHRLGQPVEELQVSEGLVSHVGGTEKVSYWELMQNRQFGIEAQGIVKPRISSKHSVVGTTVQRLDLRDKLTGKRVFIQDLDLPAMKHARVIRPPAIGAKLSALNFNRRDVIDTTQIIVDGSFVAVVAMSEIDAIEAHDFLKRAANWDLSEVSSLPDNLPNFLVDNAKVGLPVVDGIPVNEDVPEPVNSNLAASSVDARYFKPFHMHGSLGPSAAVALWEKEKLTIWSHSQGPFVLRAAVAQALGIDKEQVRVIHSENAGCYGHNGADDAAFEAALLARYTAGSPVLLKWSREDEHCWEPYSPAMVMRIRADLDGEGRIVAWNHDVYSNTHMARPMPLNNATQFVSAWFLADSIPRPEPQPGMMPHGGIHRNADPYYDIPDRRIVKHLVKKSPLRTSAARALGAYANVFAIESFMDELAVIAEIDPVIFRQMHLSDPRALAVIDAAQRSFVQKPFADYYVGEDSEHQLFGKGMAFARYKNTRTYAAVFIGLCMDSRTFEIKLLHAVIGADAGRIIDSDGLANQLEGGLIQSASWTLKEQVTFSNSEVSSRGWSSYPILTFPEVPTVDTLLLDHPDLPSLGAGEATQGPTAAAIANAIYDATGLRVRDIPFTAENLRQLALNAP